MSRVGELLVHEGAVSSAGLRRALTFQRYGGQGLRLGTILVGWNLADEETLLKALSDHHGCPAIPWSELERASPEAVALLPAEIAEATRAIPVKEELRGVHVAFANPSDLAAVDRVSSVVRRRVIPAVALEIRILQAQAFFYGIGIPADHRPILFKLLEASDKAPAPRRSRFAEDPFPEEREEREGLRASRDAPIVTALLESSEVEEVEEIDEADIVEQTPVAFPPTEPAPKERTHPMAILPRPGSDPRAAGQWPIPSGLWLGGEEIPEEPPSEDVLEEVTELQPEATPADFAVSAIHSLPRPGREEVARAVLETLLRDIPRALVLAADKEHLFGVYGKGIGVPIDHVQMIHLLPADGSILQRVQETRMPHFGKPAVELWPAPLAVLLGLDPPDCAILPLENLNGFVGVLYADRAGKPMLKRDVEELTRAAAFLANALASTRRLG